MAEKKEDRRVKRTKKMLTQALTQLLAQKQINEITVTELTDLADINRGTFYLYYRDIYDMLEKIEDELFREFDQIVERAEIENKDVQTRPILLDLFIFIENNREMCRVLLSTNGDMNFLHRLNEVVRGKCLAIWGKYEEESEAEFDYHYSFAIYGCAGMIRAWVNRNCPESAERMAEVADSMIRRGILEGVNRD